MDSKDTQTKPGIMARLRNSKGFSLVEMAIVLVIIGVIIGAIIKGQDLILNSRAKQVTSAVSTWRNLTMAYLDRNGRLPGDVDKSGSIGDAAAELLGGASAIDEIVATMTNAPANPVLVGGMSFYIYLGNAPAAVGTRNVIVLCKDAACATVFTADELEIVKAIDTAEDGSADGGLGQFRAISAAVASPAGITAALAAANSRANRVIRTVTTPDVTAAGAALPWSVAQFGAVWAFDRPY